MNLTCVPCDHGGVVLQNSESREIVDVVGNPTEFGIGVGVIDGLSLR
jgi:hypothetical protein